MGVGAWQLTVAILIIVWKAEEIERERGRGKTVVTNPSTVFLDAAITITTTTTITSTQCSLRLSSWIVFVVEAKTISKVKEATTPTLSHIIIIVIQSVRQSLKASKKLSSCKRVEHVDTLLKSSAAKIYCGMEE